MSANPDSRDFKGAIQAPHTGADVPTRDFQGSLARDRNRRTDIPSPPPLFIARYVTGIKFLWAWHSFTFYMGDLATTSPTNQMDLRRKYWNKTVQGDNTMHEIYVPAGDWANGDVTGTTDINYGIPFTNVYNIDPTTNTPSSCSQLITFWLDPNVPFPGATMGNWGRSILNVPTVTNIWTANDEGDTAQAEQTPPSYPTSWFPNYVLYPHSNPGYATDYTVNTRHWHLHGTLPSGAVASDETVTLSNEVDFTGWATPTYNAVRDQAFPAWRQILEIAWKNMDTLGGIENHPITDFDYSAYDGSMTIGYPDYGSDPTEVIAVVEGSFSALGDASVLGDTHYAGPGEFNCQKAEVLFLRKANYVITQYEVWTDGNKNPTVIGSGLAKPADTVLLPVPAFFAPTYDLDGPGDGTGGFRTGTQVVLTATPA